jgi:hypothetical protein
MSDPIPFCDEGDDLGFQIIEIIEIGGGHPLALKDGEPLLHLIHP